MAAPSKLTPAIRQGLCRAVGKGMPLARACRLLGVGPSTVRGWLADARKGKHAPAKAALLAGITRAREELIARRLDQLEQCCSGGVLVRETIKDTPHGQTIERAYTAPDPKSIMWHLAMADPAHFSADKKRLAELEKKLAELEKAYAAVAPPGAPA